MIPVGRGPASGPGKTVKGGKGDITLADSLTGPKVTACESENEAKKANTDTR
jgi:hypothetical protein